MNIHRWLRTSSLFLLFTLLSALSLPAHSQTAPTGMEGSQKADELFRKGKALYKGGQLREAYEAYRAAWELKRSYDIASNLGNAEMQLGLRRDAAEHYAFFIRNFPSTGNKVALDHAKEHFENARREIGALIVVVDVEGAEVLIDGKSIGRAPLVDEIYVDPGSRTVEAKLSGHAPFKRIVQVNKGPAQKISLALVAVTAPPPPSASAVPLASASAGSGDSGTPPPAGSTSATPPPVEPGGPSKALLVTGGTAAGLAVVAGVVFAVVAQGKSGDIDQKVAEIGSHNDPNACISGAFVNDCNALHDLRQDRVRFTNLAFWSFVGAGALGAGTVIYALAAPKSPQSSRVRVVPAVAAQGGGVLISGAW